MEERFQTGHIYEASNSFFVRFYQTEIIDGTEARVQRSHRLCVKDAEHPSKSCKAVMLLAAAHMLVINGHVPSTSQTVVDFWNTVYLPFATENLRHSTVH